MNKKLALAAIVLANLLIAGFCAFGYFAFTENMIVKTGGRDITRTSMAHGGLAGGVYRYLFCAVAALFLQAILSIFNISALGFIIERDYPGVVRTTVFLALLGFCTMLLITGCLILLSAS